MIGDIVAFGDWGGMDITALTALVLDRLTPSCTRCCLAELHAGRLLRACVHVDRVELLYPTVLVLIVTLDAESFLSRTNLLRLNRCRSQCRAVTLATLQTEVCSIGACYLAFPL